MDKHDFFDMINTVNASESDKQYFELQNKYYKLFGHNIPRDMIPPSISEDAIVEAVKRCISEGKDILMDIFKIEIDSQNKY